MYKSRQYSYGRRSRFDEETFVLWLFGIMVALFIALTAVFVWYVLNGLPRTYPTNHNNFLYGLMQGYYIVATFIISLFNHKVTVYQVPNSGVSYNLGFVLGIMAAMVSFRLGSWSRRYR